METHIWLPGLRTNYVWTKEITEITIFQLTDNTQIVLTPLLLTCGLSQFVAIPSRFLTDGIVNKLRNPDIKVHGAHMVPTWVLTAPDGPHVGPMNLAIREPIVPGPRKMADFSQTFSNAFTSMKVFVIGFKFQ